MKAVMLIGFLSFPILSQINQLFGYICANFDFQDEYDFVGALRWLQ